MEKALEFLDNIVLSDPTRETSYIILMVGNGPKGTASARITYPDESGMVAVSDSVQFAVIELAKKIGYNPTGEAENRE